MPKIEEIALKLEQSYEQLQILIKDIESFQGIVEGIERATKDFTVLYEKAANKSNFEDIKKQNKAAVDSIIVDVKKIEDSLLQIEVLKQQTTENIAQFARRIGTLEDSFKKTKQVTQDIDTKLTVILKTTEKINANAEGKLIKASKIFEINAEIERFDELLKLERENNKLLKEIQFKQQKTIIHDAT